MNENIPRLTLQDTHHDDWVHPMTTADTLCELARQVRRDTLMILDAAHEDWLTYAPAGTSNHIIWHAGHSLWLQDLLCEQLLGAGRQLPEDWEERFAMNCRPVGEIKSWPSRDQLRDLLTEQLQRVVKLISDANPQRLAEVACAERGPATVADRIIHGFHDEAKHCGEMYLLLKLCRVRDQHT